ncbi:unnamed protein product, partial [Rotaria sp. Silwood1]
AGQQEDITEADATATFNSTDAGREVQDMSTGSDCDTEIQPASAKLLNQQLLELADRYEIQIKRIKCLCKLEKFKIVILCDDSGSMQEPVDGGKTTRWDELRDIVKMVIKIGCIFEPNGVDVYFLNRPNKYTIKHPNEAEQLFDVPPSGFTPLVRSLRQIFQLPEAQKNSSKKLLIFIATDGYPTDDEGTSNFEEFENVMRNERQSETTHVSFLICTDEPESVDYLAHFDRTMKNVDVTDDFKTEKATICRHQGANFKFSKGDYIVKALVGAIDQEIDELNEPKPENQNRS